MPTIERFRGQVGFHVSPRLTDETLLYDAHVGTDALCMCVQAL